MTPAPDDTRSLGASPIGQTPVGQTLVDPAPAGTAPGRFGARLLATLPMVYRSRDSQGELARYLDSIGPLFDRLQALLRQRLDDSFPDSCQDWLLPYFAQLLDVQLRAPSVAGQRREVERAIAWRQGKGTLPVAAEIVQTVAGLPPIAMQEGWQRVLRTARVGEAPLRPSLTADTRQRGRGVAPWNDPRQRSVDTRSPDWQRGHDHPRRLLIHVPPPAGFFDAGAARQTTVSWSAVRAAWPAVFGAAPTTGAGRRSDPAAGARRRSDPAAADLLDIELGEDGMLWLRRKPGVAGGVAIRGDIDGLEENRAYGFDGINLLGTVKLPLGARVRLQRLAAKGVTVQTTGAKRGLQSQTVTSRAGHLSGGIALHAVDCLLQAFRVPRGLVQLEACTVLADSVAQALNASDCLLMGTVRRDLPRHAPGPVAGCLRYSRLSPAQPAGGCTVVAGTCCSQTPVFWGHTPSQPGYGVLHPASSAAIRQGAEDGAELGAFHHRRHAWAWDATGHKLAEHLPLGMVAVLVPVPTPAP